MGTIIKKILMKKVLSIFLCLCLLAGALAAVIPIIAQDQADVSLLPATQSVEMGDEFDVVIRIETGTQQMTGADCHLDFDPTKLMVVDADTAQDEVQITPGTEFSTIIQNKVDNTSGEIDFSAGTLNTPFPSGTFDFATIRFRALAVTDPTTAVTFSTTIPRKTLVSFGGEDITGTLTGGIYIITEATTTPPSVTTEAATDVTHNSATLNGTLDNLGTASTVNVSFQWGTVSGVYPNETTPQPLTATGAFNASLSGLLPETTYYYRAKAAGDSTSFGAEMSFITAAEPDTTPPTVVSTNPADGAINVPVSTTISVTFSEAMNQAVTQGAFSITPAVTGSFSWNGAGTVLTFTPSADLTNSTLYSVTISTAAEDLAGNNLAAQYNFSFTTAALGLVPPSVTTNAATGITVNSATLNGILNDLGTASSVDLSFEYGLTTGYGSTITGIPSSLSAPNDFIATISGLTPNTLYHFRAVAVGDGTAVGDDMTFTTLPPPMVAPSVTTQAATDVTHNSATLNGTLANLGTASTVNVSFQWGTVSGVYPNETTLQSLTATGTFNASLSGLLPETTYYYRAKAAGDGTNFGAEMSFTTAALPPGLVNLNLIPASQTVTVGEEFEVAIQVVSGSQEVTAVGSYLDFDPAKLMVIDADSAQAGVQITPGAAFPVLIANEVDNAAGQINFAAGILTGTNPSGTFTLATIRFKALAVADPATAVTFSTAMPRETKVGYGGDDITGTLTGGAYTITGAVTTPPSVTTDAATNVTHNSAILNGTLNDLGTASTVNVFFQWGTASGVYSNETTPQLLTATGAFNASLSGLLPETTYFYRARAAGDGTSFGVEMSFTTLVEPDTTPPTVVSTSPLDGAVDVPVNTAISVLFSEAMNQAATEGAFSITPSVSGSFSWNGTGTVLTFTPSADLTNSTLYSVTISTAVEDLAGNNLAEQYNFSFTTIQEPVYIPPAVQTLDAILVTSCSAVLKGNLSDLGTADTVKVYFEWGTTTDYGNVTKAWNMTSEGVFFIPVTGLSPDTLYHFRAVAEGDGVSYGSDQTFVTLKKWIKPLTVTTLPACGITKSAAHLKGFLESTGGVKDVRVSFDYGLTTDYGFSTPEIKRNNKGAFTAKITGLTSGTTYHFRAKVTIDGFTVYGEDLTFTTLPAPMVITKPADQITGNSARLNGYLESKGSGSGKVRVYFEWGLTTEYGNTTPEKVKTSKGSFNTQLSGLLPETTYHYRAVAAGSDGSIAYGADMSFTTSSLHDKPGQWNYLFEFIWRLINERVDIFSWLKGFNPFQ